MMTRRAPARRCPSHLSAVRKTPVDSITTSTPTSPQADAAGSFTALVRTGRPSSSRKLSFTATEPAKLVQVVEGDHLDVVTQLRRAERRASDAPESVDADLDHDQALRRSRAG